MVEIMATSFEDGGGMVGPTGGIRGGVGLGGVGTPDPVGLAADAEAAGSGEGGSMAGLEPAPDLTGALGVRRGGEGKGEVGVRGAGVRVAAGTGSGGGGEEAVRAGLRFAILDR
ncbi:uncharacterized protein [Miscanthus floridulus]|uniref:uncharacterized protein n=1 Tax=Miscanthus floridulus TaxID=154761 RepID=UPI0034577418